MKKASCVPVSYTHLDVYKRQVTIRETEKRMAELHTLKGHIINYVKTREVYACLLYTSRCV